MSGRRAEQVGRARAASIRRRMPPPRRHPLQEDMRAAWSSAFSLIEILIVVALLGTIVAIALPAYMDSLDKARVARAIGDIAAISEEIALFWFDSGRWPNSLAEIGRGAMTDPYGELYRYTNIGDSKTGGKGGGGGGGRKDRFLVPVNSDFDLYSMGKDTATVLPFTAQQSLDDVVRANNGMFIGLAEDF